MGRWSPQNEARLREMWTAKATVEEIAADPGIQPDGLYAVRRTVGAVNRRRNILQLPNRKRGPHFLGATPTVDWRQVTFRASPELEARLPPKGHIAKWVREACVEKADREGR